MKRDIANEGTGTISKVTSAGNVTNFVSRISQPNGIAFDRDGSLWVTAFGSNTAVRFTSAGSIASAVSGLRGPWTLAFAPVAVTTPANVANVNPAIAFVGLALMVVVSAVPWYWSEKERPTGIPRSRPGLRGKAQ